MNTFRTALKALSHPLSLFAIVILLVNDHILKVVMPSSLTGKLSDFAGLFFFPFLLAGLLGWVGERVGFSSRPIARIAFGMTALWFAGIKTIPAWNTFTAEVAEVFLGHPTFYVLDPTDLISLVVLPFAWNLWRRMEEERRSVSIKPLQVFAFGLAVVGTMASQPCPPELKVQRVVNFENTLYVYFEQFDPPFFSSMDYGNSWQRVDEMPLFVSEELQTSRTFPIQECVTNNPQTCYRITGDTYIEVSQDGGKTWKIAWRAPTWRSDYFHRWVVMIYSCRKFPDFSLNDLILLSYGKDDFLVIASLGNQGIVTFQPSRGWKQIAILNAEPSPPFISTENFDELPLITSFELVTWIIMSFVIAIKLTSSMKTRLRLEKSNQFLERGKWKNIVAFFLLPFLILFFWHLATNASINLLQGIPYMIVTFLLLLYSGVLTRSVPGYIFISLTSLLIITFHLYLAKWLSKATPKKFQHLLFTLFGFCSSLLLFLAGWLPFAFWALGWIPIYWLAFILSFGLAIVVYIKALQTLEKFKTGDSLPG